MTHLMLKKGGTDLSQIQSDIFNLLKSHYLDAFLIRYTDGSQKVVTSAEYEKETKARRENDAYWLTLSTIQLVPSSKIGIGKIICFDFMANGFEKKLNDVNRHRPDYHAQQKFDYKSYLKGDQTEKDLMSQNPTFYCLMVCNKIGLYLSVVYGIQLKRMSVEFSVDEFGQIWFFGASNIVIAEANKLELNYEKILPEFVKSEFAREQAEKEALAQKEQQAKIDAENLAISHSQLQ